MSARLARVGGGVEGRRHGRDSGGPVRPTLRLGGDPRAANEGPDAWRMRASSVLPARERGRDVRLWDASNGAHARGGAARTRDPRGEENGGRRGRVRRTAHGTGLLPDGAGNHGGRDARLRRYRLTQCAGRETHRRTRRHGADESREARTIVQLGDRGGWGPSARPRLWNSSGTLVHIEILTATPSDRLRMSDRCARLVTRIFTGGFAGVGFAISTFDPGHRFVKHPSDPVDPECASRVDARSDSPASAARASLGS